MITDNQNRQDEFFMRRCLELAWNGMEQVAPNPMVGSVICFEGRAVGEGYHQVYGGAHAEVNAIRSVRDMVLLKKSTLYVNLEPCAHQGKTPPCSDLIIESGIPRVVIGTSDSNSLVAGKGIEKLRKAGIDVRVGVLEPECLALNRRFFTYHEKKRPYIILKWAQTQDGFLDVIRQPGDPIGVNWITNPLSRLLVHRWRSQEQAIMVGSNTVLFDNPQLNVRYWEGRDPIRVLIDRKLRIPSDAHIFNYAVPTIVFNLQQTRLDKNLQYIQIRQNEDLLKQVFDHLYQRNIASVFVEGGSKLLNELLLKGYWDEARVLTGLKTFGRGVEAPKILLSPSHRESLLDDRLTVYRRPADVNDIHATAGRGITNEA